MLLLRLWNYIRGYVIILVEGFFYEKFINICTHRQILLWDIKRQRDNVLSLKISIKGFKLLRPIAKKTGCSVKIIGKKGLPFIINRYRRRKAFLIGAIVFVSLIYILTSFVWAIEITGNKEMETGYIAGELAEIGIKPGVLKYAVNTEEAVNAMMLRLDRLAWISITVKGTIVKVQIAERKMPPVLIPKDEPCNIVARRDGMIKSITVKDGIEVVKPGDTVTKGQMLVSGLVPIRGEEGRSRPVHAIASVIARTWYESECPVTTLVTERIRTGKVKENYSIVLFTKRIDLFQNAVEFGSYDMDEIKKTVALGQDMVLPFELIIQRYYELADTEREIDIGEAKRIALEKAYEEAVKDISVNAEIIKTDVRFSEGQDGVLAAQVSVECIEEIGVEQKIGGN